MRKQTKLVAVASAAALLAVGASMTSFAAAGWVEEDGQWFFYDRDGNRVENTWKKSGDNWYWLDSEEGGAMAIDKLIEDGEEEAYRYMADAAELSDAEAGYFGLDMEQYREATGEDADNPTAPSSIGGDYSPAHPWDAPGMSMSDFI